MFPMETQGLASGPISLQGWKRQETFLKRPHLKQVNAMFGPLLAGEPQPPIYHKWLTSNG